MKETLDPSYLQDKFTERFSHHRIAFALNAKQRFAIRERDNNECQGCGITSICTRNTPDRIHLQVHHIIPQGYSKRMGIDPDYPENLITICENLHIGHPTQSVHPDTYQARETYRGQKESYNQMIEARKVKLENREIYWNTQYDRQFHVIATRNTQRIKVTGWHFPEKNEK